MSSGTSDNLSFTYNADGIRTSKTVNGVKHIYALSGSTVLSEEWTENGVQHLIIYAYDTAGSPIGMLYRNSTYLESFFDSYLFGKNIQGDILYIYDGSGNRIVSYTYDAWGNILSVAGTKASTVGKMNPFRYRGYYYDVETGLYYLNSRYYDPVVGRFINADGYISTGQGLLSFNMFAYCGNNPTNYIDPSGYLFIADDMVVWGFTALSIATLLIASSDTISISFAENTSALINPIPIGLLDSLTDVGTIAVMEPSELCVPMPYIEYVSTLDAVTTITYEASHRKRNGSKKKTNDKHTNKRSGSTKDKAKNKAGWEYRGNKKHGPIDYTPIVIFDLQIVLNNNSDRDEVVIWKPIF